MWTRLSTPLTAVLMCMLAISAVSIASGPPEDAGQGGGKPPRPATITLTPTNPTTSTTAAFSFESKGGGSKLSYICQLDAMKPEPCLSPVKYENLTGGVHAFKVVTSLGDEVSTPTVHLWTVEPPAPTPPATPTIDSGPAGTTTSTTASFTFSSETGGVSFLCRVDGNAFATCSSPKSYSALSLGGHRFEVKAVSSGGLQSGVASHTWTIEAASSPTPSPPATPPPASAPATPTITSGPASVTTETSASFAFSSSTTGVSYLCRLDAAGFAACTSPRAYSGLALGSHRFEVKARDAAGVDSGVAALTWQIEPPPPPSTPPPPSAPATPTITAGPASVTTETSASFTFSSVTAGVSFLCRLDAATFAACTSPRTYGGLAVGSHRFEVKARDAAGVDSGVAALTWQIQAPPPPPPTPPAPPSTPTITQAPPAVTNDTAAALSFTSATAGVSFLCRLDGSAYAACTSPKSYSALAAGGHRFEVKARDSAGVESGVAATTWTVDVGSPTVTLTSPAPGSQVSSTVQVAAAATDNVGVARVEMRVDGALKGSSTVAPHTFVWDTTRETNGQHTVELRAFDTAGNTSAPTSGAYLVSNLAPGSCTGVQVAPGTDVLGSAIAANPATTFCLRAGVHRLTSAVVAKAGSTFVGEPGAILSGARDISSSFQQSGAVWVASGMPYEGYGTAFEDPCGPPWGASGSTLCLRTNNVFYDDRWLTRVGSLGELSSGEFFFDYGADRIYIADSPVGHKVEVAVSPQAFRSHGTGSYNVTLRGLVVEKFANPISTHAIEGNDGWLLERVEVRFNHGCGASGNVVRSSLFHDNGQCGFTGSDDNDIVVENSEFYENHRVPVVCWHTASVKILRSQGAVVRGNYAHDEDCLGLWTDWDNIGTLYEGNRTERIGGPGIFHEASFDAVIRNNIVRNSGYWREFDGWIDGSGILVNSSRNVEIYGNTVEGNRHGIGATNTNRGSNATYGARETRNLRVHDNTIRVGAGRTAGGVAGIIYQPFTSNQALYSRNTYGVCSSSVWSGPKPAGSTSANDLTWSEWRAQGQDANSTISITC